MILRAFLLVCLTSSVAWAQVAVPVRNNGPSANRIDIVILGDGYTAGELAGGVFAQHVENAVALWFADPVYGAYAGYFNVTRVEVASAESGVDHPERSVFKDTAFDGHFNCFNIQRLTCVNLSKVTQAMTDSGVASDAREIVLVLLNDTEYGGSGGSIAVASTHSSVVELILHEVGHSFAQLADEYGGPAPPSCVSSEPSEVNATADINRATLKWRHWVSDATSLPTPSNAGVPGAFEGARYCDTGMYRPTVNSKMRSLNRPFEAVNDEQHVKRMYNFVSPIDALSPAAGSINVTDGGTATFALTVLQPAAHDLSVTWRLDGVTVPGTSTGLSLSTASWLRGVARTVTLEVRDGTTFVRNDPTALLVETRKWTVTAVGCAAMVSPGALTAPRAGASLTLSVTDPPGCAASTWTAASGAPFVTVTPSGGTGAGTVSVSVAANATGAARSTTVTIAGRSITVTQAGPTLQTSPTSLRFTATRTGPTGPVVYTTAPQEVTLNFDGISPAWTASSSAAWLSLAIGPHSGTGNGRIRVNVENADAMGADTRLSGSITITVTGGAIAPTVIPVTLTVLHVGGGAGTAPFGQVDTPTQNAAGVQGAVGVTGWVLDDVGVAGVQIFRNCLPWEDVPSGYCQTILTGTPQAARVVFVGNAAFLAGARPDVEAGFSTFPQAYRAGWGMLVLTPMLPDVTRSVAYGGQGALTIYAVATDVEGQKVLLGRSSDPASPDLRTPTAILMDNNAIAKPFGTIDTPALGETIGGVIPNFGWALTPDVNTTGGEPGDVLIPTNGFTMTVFIDGLPTAQVIYNQCRVPGQTPSTFCTDDVSNIFGNPTPQPSLQARAANTTRFRNLDVGRAPIGAYVLDTATLSNGLHTIAWSVSDSLGRTEGIGSRFFTVLNSGGGDAADAAADAVEEATLRAAPAMARAPAWVLQRVPSGTHGVWARTGFDLTRGWDSVTPDDTGRRIVEISEGGRVELWLGAAAGRGFLVANRTLRDLPPGATLRGAQFAWVPPVGYIGDYALVFLRGGERVEVTVRIK